VLRDRRVAFAVLCALVRCYSERKAISGFTRPAFHAGRAAASIDTPNSTTDAPASVAGSLFVGIHEVH